MSARRRIATLLLLAATACGPSPEHDGRRAPPDRGSRGFILYFDERHSIAEIESGVDYDLELAPRLRDEGFKGVSLDDESRAVRLDFYRPVADPRQVAGLLFPGVTWACVIAESAEGDEMDTGPLEERLRRGEKCI